MAAGSGPKQKKAAAYLEYAAAFFMSGGSRAFHVECPEVEMAPRQFRCLNV
jgi:hypothetical protein